MKKIIISTLSLVICSFVFLPNGVFGATTELEQAANAPTSVTTPTKIKDIIPLTPAEAKVLTAKLNKEHNEKAFDKKFFAKAKIAAAKHEKLVKKNVKAKNVVLKKPVVKKTAVQKSKK